MNAIQIVNVEQDGTDGILVTFSDGTNAGYVAEELIELRPVREKVSLSSRPQKSASHSHESSVDSKLGPGHPRP